MVNFPNRDSRHERLSAAQPGMTENEYYEINTNNVSCTENLCNVNPILEIESLQDNSDTNPTAPPTEYFLTENDYYDEGDLARAPEN